MKEFFRKEGVRRALHICALFILAVAQPVFDILAKNPTFFVANHASPLDIIVLTVLLCFVLPGILSLFIAGLRRVNSRLGDITHIAVLSVLMAVILLPIEKRLADLPPVVFFGLAALAGTAFGMLYARSANVRTYTTALSLAIVVVPVVFLFFSPVQKILFPGEYRRSDQPKIKAKTPIVLVIFDEFSLVSLMDSNHEIDSLRYPNLAALARQAYWFRNATTVCDRTDLAVPAILTGKLPDLTTTKLPTYGDYPDNLFTLLGGQYKLYVSEVITSICPPKLASGQQQTLGMVDRLSFILSDLKVVYLHLVMPSEISSKLPTIQQNWGHFDDSPQKSSPLLATLSNAAMLTKFGNAVEDRMTSFRSYLQNVKNHEEASLYFLHLLLPHVPWAYLPSGKMYMINKFLPTPGLDGEMWRDDEWAVLQGYQRYLLQVGATDKFVGELVARLKESQSYDGSLVIITSDHGVSFKPKDARRPLTTTNFMDILPIPLIVKLPNQQEGVVSDRNVETIDILPTIADVLGTSVPWQVDGVSMFDTAANVRPAKRALRSMALDKPFYQTYSSSLNEKYQALQQQLRIFGKSRHPDSLFSIGDDYNLINRKPTELRSVTDQRLNVWIDNRDFYLNVDTRGDILLSQVSGKLYRQLPNKEEHVAIVVNGVICAVTQTYKDGEGAFAAMVPESSFREGKNDVEVYLIDGKGGSPVLIRPRGVLTYSIVRDVHGNESLKLPNGELYPILVNEYQGAVDTLHFDKNKLHIAGWAADLSTETTPDNILVFLNDAFFHIGVADIARGDFSKQTKSGKTLTPGYRFTLVSRHNLKEESPFVRVIALYQNKVASEIRSWKDIRSSVSSGIYMVAKTSSGSMLRSSRQEIPIVHSPLQVHLDHFAPSKDSLEVVGWSANAQSNEVADSVAVFLDDQNLFTLSTGVNRPDVAKFYKHQSFRTSGFMASVPLSVVRGVTDLDRFRFFALSKGSSYATEMDRPNPHPHAARYPKPTDRSSLLPGEVFSLHPGEKKGEMFLFSRSGKKIPVTPDVLSGSVDAVRGMGDSIMINGWAADMSSSSPAAKIVVMLNGQCAAVFATGLARPDVSSFYKKGNLKHSGFAMFLPRTLLGKPLANSGVQIFAISIGERVATELKQP